MAGLGPSYSASFGAGPATSGSQYGASGLGSAGGISAPVIIGGYKTGAAASATTGVGASSAVPSWVWYGAAAAAALGLVIWLARKK